MFQFNAILTIPQTVLVFALTLLLCVGQASTFSSAAAAERLDLYGDPLPDGALSRLGTVRFRHNGWHKRITFLADNETLVVGTVDNTVRLWNVNSGRKLRSIELGGTRLQAFAVARHGKNLATISGISEPVTRQFIGAMNVWDATTWKDILSIPFVEPIANSAVQIAISPDGTTVVIGTANGTLRFLDVPSKQELLRYDTKYIGIQSIEFSPSGELIAVATRREVVLGPWRNQDQQIRLPNLPRGGQVAVFSPDGKQLAVGSNDGYASQLYEVPSGKLIHRMRGKATRYYREGLAFHPSENQLIVPGDQINKLEFFDLDSGDVKRTLETGLMGPRDVAVTSNGRFAAVVGSDAEIKVWNLSTGEVISDRFVGHAEAPDRLEFLSNGKGIATAAGDGTVRLWNIESGSQVHVMRHDNESVHGLAVSDRHAMILSTGFDNTVRLWNGRSGKAIFRLHGHGRLGLYRTNDVEFDLKSNTLFSFGNDLNLRRWDIATGKAIAEHAIRPSGTTIKLDADGKPVVSDPFGDRVDGKSESVTAARFSADGKSLFVMVGLKKLCSIDTVTAKENYQIELSQPFNEFAFSHDTTLLAIIGTQRQQQQNGTTVLGSRTADLTLIRMPSAEVVWKVEVPGTYSGDLQFSSDGKWLSACLHGESPTAKSQSWIEIISTENGRPVYRIDGFDQNSNNVAFSHDGKYLAASYEDSTVLIWELEKFRVK